MLIIIFPLKLKPECDVLCMRLTIYSIIPPPHPRRNQNFKNIEFLDCFLFLVGSSNLSLMLSWIYFVSTIYERDMNFTNLEGKLHTKTICETFGLMS